ncbi:enoyl-CoA hydratase/isomerase family protein [Nocardia paucivorans]|uniref:enoyl-CoA hydratase/isomerase family protein n=1 Tax=Nocardia paucivorans TaxID=114259 RepID=UPI0002EB44EF|nr:enoyl-CoA hydratase/isomerase family protein [Nocardia paucivorans]
MTDSTAPLVSTPDTEPEAAAPTGGDATAPVLIERRDSTLMVTLNRPERLNAVNEELYRALLGALRTAEDDAQVRCVLLSGAGRAFCVGADMKEHRAGTRTARARQQYVQLGQDVCHRIQTATVPVVAAVHGYALGAGAELAVSSDFLLMTEDARMGFPEVSIGTFVGGGITHRLPRLVGLRRATDLLMLGERFTGTQALDWGLAHAAVPGTALRDTAMRLAERLAGQAPLSLARMKAALYRADPVDIAFRTEPQNLLALMETEDWAEGVAAFAERRTPVFRGK